MIRGREWGRDLLVEGGGVPGRGEFDALRTYRYLYAEYTTGERELYDLERDPYELQSRHADPALRGRARAARPQAVEPEGLRRPFLPHAAPGADARAGLQRTRLRQRARTRGLPQRPPPAATRRAPFRALVAGRRLRARVRTLDGRVVTLDRRLPRACR